MRLSLEQANLAWGVRQLRQPRRRSGEPLRYIGTERDIDRIESQGWGSHSIWTPKRIPRAVRQAFQGLRHGRHEVEYDPKTRVAKVIPLWDMWRI